MIVDNRIGATAIVGMLMLITVVGLTQALETKAQARPQIHTVEIAAEQPARIAKISLCVRSWFANATRVG